MRTAVLIAGILLLLAGLLWIGQGTGYFPYPSYSFMISEMTWAYRGAGVALVGIIVIYLSRRMAR
jgi:membrane protein implicated in regulation of membrane protease activity